MAKRKIFETDSESFEIYRNADGSVTIEATSEYGDSETGWGSTSSTLHLTPDRVAELRRFLEA